MVAGLAGANLAEVGPANPNTAAGAKPHGHSIFDTISPTTPCYRRGIVIQAMSISQAGRRLLHRDAFQARELGMALVRRKDDIDAKVAEAIRLASHKLKIRAHSIKLIDFDVMSRFAPGLILDFPAHQFHLGRLVVRERTCVTVCTDDAASKIWIRFIVSDVEGSALNPADISRFFRFCDEAARIARVFIEAIYLEEFRSHYQGRNQVEFEEVGAIDFVGVDTRALQFDDFLNTDETGPVMGSDKIPESSQNLFSDFFKGHIESCLPKRFTREEISHISKGHIAAFRSEFEYRALYHGVFREKEVTFLVMSEPGTYVKAFGREESGALTVISELAARAVRQF